MRQGEVAMNRLKELRNAKGISQEQLGKVLNVQKSAISKYEKERVPLTAGTLEAIAKYFNVTTDYVLGVETARGLMNFDKPKKLSDAATIIAKDIQDHEDKVSKGIRIPVLGTIAAGTPIDAYEEIIGWEEITESMAAKGEFFALRVHGRSMEPRLIEGDIVIVKKEHDVRSGRVAVVLVGREEATLKKVNKAPDGITLIGYNALVYEPHFYSNTEIEELPIQILGEVVELRRKF
jgi:repressor LexA